MSLLSAGERERRERAGKFKESERGSRWEKQRREKRTFEWQTVVIKGSLKRLNDLTIDLDRFEIFARICGL